MIRSMLYATDLGLYAPYVMQHALALARTFKADLYVIHVVEPIGLFAESVLQSYLDEKALNEWQNQGLSTVMATIEESTTWRATADLANWAAHSSSSAATTVYVSPGKTRQWPVSFWTSDRAPATSPHVVMTWSTETSRSLSASYQDHQRPR